MHSLPHLCTAAHHLVFALHLCPSMVHMGFICITWHVLLHTCTYTPGWILRFKMAPRYYASEVHLRTDYPAPGSLYKRNQLRKLPWTYSTKKPTWDPDRYVEIELDIAGPYRFEYTAESPGEKGEGSGYFVVDPYLGYSPDSIACQTYITKLLGPLSEWKQRLMTAKDAGYNMVHFTPIQQLGSSRSAYSISNQLRIDSSYMPSGQPHTEVTASFTNCEGVSKQFKVDSHYLKVRELVKSMHDDWGVLSIVDVVWNHTSFDTPWLMQHPEAGYNLVNSPHLRPAYALDATLAQFSHEIAERKWEQVGIRPRSNTRATFTTSALVCLTPCYQERDFGIIFAWTWTSL